MQVVQKDFWRDRYTKLSIERDFHEIKFKSSSIQNRTNRKKKVITKSYYVGKARLTYNTVSVLYE